MKELVKTSRNDNGQIAVNGRDLHKFLELNGNYTTWFNRMVEYGFIEGIDFLSISEESNGGRPKQNHILKLDVAKHIAMIQRTEKGMQARNYFIEIEKQYKSLQLPSNYKEALIALIEKEEEKEKLELELIEEKDGENKILSAEKCAKQLNLPRNNTTLFHTILVHLGYGIYEKLPGNKNKRFYANQQLIEELAKTGLAITRQLDSANKSEVKFTKSIIDFLQKEHGDEIERLSEKLWPKIKKTIEYAKEQNRKKRR